MSKLQKLTPDVALRKLIDGRVQVQTSATKSHTVKAYADGERPNSKLASELIEITWNGGAQSVTQSLSVFRGNLALVVWVQAQADGRAKTQTVRSIIGQIAELVNGVTADGFYFNFTATSVIMPTNTNITTGYSTTAMNVEWHTTDNFHNT